MNEKNGLLNKKMQNCLYLGDSTAQVVPPIFLLLLLMGHIEKISWVKARYKVNTVLGHCCSCEYIIPIKC